MAKRAKTVLAGMDFESLVELRREVEQRLEEYWWTLGDNWLLWGVGSGLALVEGGGRRFRRMLRRRRRNMGGPTEHSGGSSGAPQVVE